MRITVIGLGKLGSAVAAVLADKGFTVVGVDTSEEAVAAVNEGRAPVAEPGLEALIRGNRVRLSATTDCQGAVAASDVTFVVVPTPSEANGEFSLRHVLRAAEQIGLALRGSHGFHLVVVSSTVLPGAMREHIQPLLEATSGKTCGLDFGLCYNPDFIALGSVIRDLCNPDLVLIGESDQRSGQLLEEIQRRICENSPTVARMAFVNAELAKICINTYITMKISYANMLAAICERLPGADVDVVTAALGADSRIGPRCLKGGIGYGGPCFPRDNVAFSAIARRIGAEAPLSEVTDRLNRGSASRLGDLVASLLQEGQTAGILGLAYKPLTNVVEESQGVMLAQYLCRRKARVVVYDPEAMGSARRVLGGDVIFAASMEECAAQSHVLVITTPWDQFRGLTAAHLLQSRPGAVVLDCWRILRPEAVEPAARYLSLGLGPGERAAASSQGARSFACSFAARSEP
ncbi:MAG: UDP-glucose/GDP-mannose dehydrogenase family protein [Bryobacteraceae bacterium]